MAKDPDDLIKKLVFFGGGGSGERGRCWRRAEMILQKKLGFFGAVDISQALSATPAREMSIQCPPRSAV